MLVFLCVPRIIWLPEREERQMTLFPLAGTELSNTFDGHGPLRCVPKPIKVFTEPSPLL